MYKIAIFLCLFAACQGFYLPGLAPVNYCSKKDVVDNCKVSLVRSAVV